MRALGIGVLSRGFYNTGQFRQREPEAKRQQPVMAQEADTTLPRPAPLPAH